MPYTEIDIPPGVYRNGTRLEAAGRWFDANLVRWRENAMQPVGGWQKVQAGGSDIKLSDITYLDLPGESGDYASTPDATALDVAGDLDVRAAVAMDDWTPGKDPSVGALFDGRATRLEASRTNHLTRSEELDHADWTTSNVTVTADAATAPDGSTTADNLSDTSASAHGFVSQGQTVADDSADDAASVHFAKKSTDHIAMVALEYTGGTTELTYEAEINLNGGETDVSNSPDSPTRVVVEDWGDFWRVSVVGANNSTGNTTAVGRVYPHVGTTLGTRDVSVTGDVDAWGAQLEDGPFPSSYISTTTAAVTRSADDASEDISGTSLATPQEMTAYVKLREQGSGLVDSLGVFRLGSNSVPRIELRSIPNDRYGLFHDNDTSQVNANNTTAVSVGNVVELRAILHSDGSVQLGVSINGGSENLTSQSAANALSGSNWDTETLWLNSRSGGLIGFNDFLALTIAPGVKTMDEMRSLADSKGGDLYSYYPGDPVDTFSRASAASYRQADQFLSEESSGGIRDSHYVGSPAEIIGKTGPSGGYTLRLNPSGALTLLWRDSGGTLVPYTTSDAVPVVSDGELLLVRATLDVDNGSSQREVKFYTKTATPRDVSSDLEDNAEWTQLGNTITDSGATSIGAGSAELAAGSRPGGAEGLWSGKYYAAAVLDGIDGTVVFDADFTDLHEGTTSFTEDSSNAATVTINQSGDPQAEIAYDTTVDTPIQGMFAWRANDGRSLLAMGTPDRAYAFVEGSVTEITPDGFTPGRKDATSTSGIYGAGTYGVGNYGAGDPALSQILEAQTWQFDNFGELLIGVAFSDGKLYSWDLNSANDLSLVDASAPTDNVGVVVTPERFLVALGADGDPRKIQWADQESLTTWAATSTNQAGDFIVQSEGELMTGRRARGETLIWTTQELYAMRFIAGQLIYSITQVGGNCGIISRRAVAMVDGGRAFWMGHNSFFVYSGTAQPIPSEVGDHVFSDINRTQASKIHAVTHPEFTTVRWYYCSAGSTDINRYVEYNYAEGHWQIGELNRTAEVSRGIFSFGMAGDKYGHIYDHERGNSYLDVDGNALTPFAESGPFHIGKGDRTMVVQEIIPDEETLGDVQAIIKSRLYPTAPETTHGPFTLSNPTSVRLSGRQIALRVEQVEPNWRVGVPRLDVEPAGRR